MTWQEEEDAALVRKFLSWFLTTLWGLPFKSLLSDEAARETIIKAFMRTREVK